MLFLDLSWDAWLDFAKDSTNGRKMSQHYNSSLKNTSWYIDVKKYTTQLNTVPPHPQILSKRPPLTPSEAQRRPPRRYFLHGRLRHPSGVCAAGPAATRRGSEFQSTTATVLKPPETFKKALANRKNFQERLSSGWSGFQIQKDFQESFSKCCSRAGGLVTYHWTFQQTHPPAAVCMASHQIKAILLLQHLRECIWELWSVWYMITQRTKV